MALSIVPLSIQSAKMYVGKHHRHNKPPKSGLFAVGVEKGGDLAGVAIVGRPVARMLDNGKTCEVIRLCTTGEPNACSILYGACARAAKALGYEKIVTYTLVVEPGASLKASGWERVAELRERKSWSNPNRPRYQTDLFGEEQRPTGKKIRWEKQLRRRDNEP